MVKILEIQENTNWLWDTRAVKLLDNKTWAISKRGDPSDWNFGEPLTPDSAVAGTIGHGASIYCLQKLNEKQILFHTTQGLYLLDGNPCDGGSLRKVDDEQRYVKQWPPRETQEKKHEIQGARP